MSRKDWNEPGRPDARLELIGVPCPVNWARAKAQLEVMQPGESLELVTDDPRAPRDIPVAAEGEGYFVLAVRASDGVWRIWIER